MNKTFIILSILIFAATSSFAQTDSTSTYKATLQKMFKVAGTEEIYNSSIKQIFSYYRTQFQDLDTEYWDEIEQEFSKSSIDDLIDMIIPVYKKYLTEDDLKGMIEFYETPAGKNFAKYNPKITQESMQIGQQWGMKIAQDIMKKIDEKKK